MTPRLLTGILVLVAFSACDAPAPAERYDVLVSGGTIYDGSGGEPFVGDVGIIGDRIVAIGDLGGTANDVVINAHGLAVAPGFINMLSWSNGTLLRDGRAVSDLVQGVTLEVFGEGWTMGPWNEQQKRAFVEEGEIDEIPWTTLGEYLEFLVDNGVSPNVASLVGADTLRANVIGYENRPPTTDELSRMQDLVRASMEEGALGVGSALIYTPGSYASTEELIALAKAAGEYDGIYASHVRSLGERLLDGIGELLIIAREAEVDAHVYHLIAAGRSNWPKLDNAIALIEGARALGMNITSDMHPYTMAGTNLNITTPPWARDGGSAAFVERLQDEETRRIIIDEMTSTATDWENAYQWAGAEGIVVAAMSNPDFEQYEGMTIAAIAETLGRTPEDTILDLLIADGGDIYALYHIYAEENVRKKAGVAWLAFMSDSPTFTASEEDKKKTVHPRSYGTFARILGKYSREENAMSLQEAVRRLSAFPAEILNLRERGRIGEGYHADLAIFDPDTIIDRATFEEPHQLATGMHYVLVNGEIVVENGEHTGALPGQVVRGPGWTGLTS